jgi:hypothetical protein
VTKTTSSVGTFRAHDCIKTLREVDLAEIVNTLNGPSRKTLAPYESCPPAESAKYINAKAMSVAVAALRRIDPHTTAAALDDDDDALPCAYRLELLL